MEKELYTLQEVAYVLGYSINTIRKWRWQNKFKVVIIGRSVRVPKEELERLKKGD